MRTPPRLAVLGVIGASLGVPCMVACAARPKQVSPAQVASEAQFPLNSYVVNSVMIALPRDRLNQLASASDRMIEQLGTVYLGSTAMLQIEHTRAEMPRLAPYEPSADPLANESQQLRVSFTRSASDSDASQLNVRVESLSAPGQAAKDGVLVVDGRRFIVDTGIEHGDNTLAVAISAHAVRTRDDLRRLYELKKASDDLVADCDTPRRHRPTKRCSP